MTEGGDFDKLGRGAIWPGGITDYFLRCSKQTTNLASINMSQLRATPVALPPLTLQQQFASLVARHEHLRATQREAEHLFQTLLHSAFSEGVRR